MFLSGAVLKGKSTAFFGQSTAKIVDNLNLTAGIRWTEDKENLRQRQPVCRQAGFLTGAPLNPDGSGLQSGSADGSRSGTRTTIRDKAWTLMASLPIASAPELPGPMFPSEGFKGGGFTQRVFPPFAFIPRSNQKKSTTLRVRFQVDLAGRRRV